MILNRIYTLQDDRPPALCRRGWWSGVANKCIILATTEEACQTGLQAARMVVWPTAT